MGTLMQGVEGDSAYTRLAAAVGDSLAPPSADSARGAAAGQP